MARFVSPGGIEVTTPTVDGVQRSRVKDLGGIGGRARTWLGDYFTPRSAVRGWPGSAREPGEAGGVAIGLPAPARAP